MTIRSSPFSESRNQASLVHSGGHLIRGFFANQALLPLARSARLCLLALLFASGCSRPTAIGDILADPRGFDGKTVTIQGEVTGSANLAVLKGFRLRDATGEMAVVTDRAVPRPGQTLKVRGRVKQALAVDEASLVVLIERSPQ